MLLVVAYICADMLLHGNTQNCGGLRVGKSGSPSTLEIAPFVSLFYKTLDGTHWPSKVVNFQHTFFFSSRLSFHLFDRVDPEESGA
jgi:hypothetical protein